MFLAVIIRGRCPELEVLTGKNDRFCLKSKVVLNFVNLNFYKSILLFEVKIMGLKSEVANKTFFKVVVTVIDFGFMMMIIVFAVFIRKLFCQMLK